MHLNEYLWRKGFKNNSIPNRNDAPAPMAADMQDTAVAVVLSLTWNQVSDTTGGSAIVMLVPIPLKTCPIVMSLSTTIQ